MATFIERCLAGEVESPDDAIGDVISAWHAGIASVSLPEYLGMTEDEYARWVERSVRVTDIVAARMFELEQRVADAEWRAVTASEEATIEWMRDVLVNHRTAIGLVGTPEAIASTSVGAEPAPHRWADAQVTIRCDERERGMLRASIDLARALQRFDGPTSALDPMHPSMDGGALVRGIVGRVQFIEQRPNRAARRRGAHDADELTHDERMLIRDVERFVDAVNLRRRLPGRLQGFVNDVLRARMK